MTPKAYQEVKAGLALLLYSIKEEASLRRLAFLSLVGVLLLVIAMPIGSKAAEQRWLTVYYVTSGNPVKTSLVPFRVLIDQNLTAEGQIRLAFELIKYPPGRALWSAVPETLKLLGVRVTGSVVTLNLNDEVESISGLGMVGEFLDQLSWTILGVSGLERLKFEVDGHPMSSLTAEGVIVKNGLVKNMKTVEIVPLNYHSPVP